MGPRIWQLSNVYICIDFFLSGFTYIWGKEFPVEFLPKFYLTQFLQQNYEIDTLTVLTL